MAEHKATIVWKPAGGDFMQGRFSREHNWTFDGGLTVAASASPAVVPAPLSNAANIDPEEAFVASIASCHMLTFLHLARVAGFRIDGYEDQAVGHTTPNERRVPWVSSVTLNPQITFGGDKQPTPEQLAELHHKAHDGCFIAQSVKTEIKVAGVD